MLPTQRKKHESLTPSMRDALLKDGYVVVKDMHSHEALDAAKASILDYISKEKVIQNSGGVTIPDFIKIPSLAPVTAMKANPKLEAVLKELFGGDDYRFCAHNDIGVNRIVGWHKDKLNGIYESYETVDIWEKAPGGEVHEIVKVLTYLEDHSCDNDGLKLVPGSHLKRQIDPRGYIQLRPGKGDTVIFDQRITHRGMDHQVKDPRILVSFGFGRNNVFTDNFERGTQKRQDVQNGF